MKTTQLLLLPLFIFMGLQAEPIQSIEDSLKESNIKTGTTIGHYQKPGAPIDMTYLSSNVAKNEISDINITLTTSVQTGNMDVMMTFDEKLTLMSDFDENLTFEITPEQRKYPINLQVSASEDGLYYIRLLTKIDKGLGSQLRSFAVPVYIGDNPQPQTRGTQIMKAMSGENISVSKAIETIEVLDEK